MSSFYKKFIKSAQKGYTLKGGPHAKWRLPLNYQLYQKRLDVGPEQERPRSVWSNWNYDSEIFALGKRLNEDFNATLIRQAFTSHSYAVSQKEKLESIGLEYDIMQSNNALSIKGESICRNYLKAVFKFWYPNLPEEGVNSVTNYLLGIEKLASIVTKIGAKDLVKAAEFPVQETSLERCFYAIVGVLGEDTTRAHLFINDFVLTQLIGKDINEIWCIENPMGLLVEELKRKGYKSSPVSRLLWSTGATHPTGAFMVGIYVDDKFLAKGSGETVDIAEEMAARDALRRLFGTSEDSAPLPYGDKAREYSENIKKIYEELRG